MGDINQSIYLERYLTEEITGDAALSTAKACPFLDIGGSLKVSELVEMPG